MESTAHAHYDTHLTELELKPGIVTIGRTADNDIVVDEPDLSEYHAKIVTYFHMSLLST